MIETIKKLLAGTFRHPVIAKRVLKIKESVYQKVCPLEASALPSDEPLKKSELKNYRFTPVRPGYEWARKPFGACWFRLEGKLPDGYDPKEAVVVMSIGGEGVAYDGEDTVDIITPLLSVSDVLQPPSAGKRILHAVMPDGRVDCYVDCGHNGYNGNFINRAEYRYAYIAVKREDVCKYYYDYVTLALLLVATEGDSLGKEDENELVSTLKNSYLQFEKGDIEGAERELARYYAKGSDGNVLYTMVGHAHLDLAWLWPERESKRKAVRTFTNAVSMIEKNPSYVFGASQAQMFEWVKESHPALFEKLRKYVAAGNIELQGGMWVESDCNMPGGESLIRQFLYGDKFFIENFGKTSDTVWLPDAFGFPLTLPQIIKGVGKKNFATIKLTWNKINKFPYQSFYWVAPDGSRVLCHISPEGTYCNDGTPLAIAKSEKKNIQKETGRALIIYGVGDGGGGPGEGHIKIAERCADLRGTARSVMGSAQSFFDDLEKVQSLPEYRDELYLEKHQGTLTSQSNNKKLNRLAERELHTAEWLCAITEKTDLSGIWKKLLFTQFHDVLPGSGIERVHTESCAQLKESIADARAVYEDRISRLSSGKGLSAINPSPFYRDEYVTVNGESYRFAGEGYSAGPLVKEKPFLAVGEYYIENGKVAIKLAEDGTVASFIDKNSGEEISLGGLNRLRVYRDKKLYYNAWDIDINYVKYPEDLKAVSVKTYIDGSYAVAETEYVYNKSKIKQFLRISADSFVRVDNEIFWQEEHKMLRAEFFPTVTSDFAECDIQFGHIDRSAKEEDSVDRAKFEICAHKYVAYNDGERTFAVYSDCKYGYRAKNGMISLNLLRSPKYPDKNCDMGVHFFSYAFDFHTGKRETVRRGYNFSYPLIISDEQVAIKPFLVTDGNVIVENIKPAEEEGTVVRMYEREGTETTVNLSFLGKTLYLTDMLENVLEKVDGTITFRPHEIKTILIK